MGSKIIQDDEGNTSSMRVVWIVIWMVVLSVWAYVSIHNKELANLSIGDSLGVGFLMVGKAGQKYVEKNTNTKRSAYSPP